MPNIKLKAGLEIHQQLDTGKLFCRCKSILRKDKPDFVVTRKLHAVPGESGEIDEAALFEHLRDREFVYEGYYDNTCLVELDEEPPREINKEALEIALQIALLLNCKILPVTQIMRKTVLDGSNVSGFQRTVLIAKDGYVETSYGKIGIATICLEEDAARIVRRENKRVVYRLDRLGIPLVEIATEPEIKYAKQAREVALHIGEVLRACKVRRGIGTIRQDVNLSVNVDGKQGARIEIKGVQEPRLIEKTIETEVRRQVELIAKGESKPEVRKALPDGTTEFLRPLPGAARMYPETDLPLLKIPRQLIDSIKQGLPRLKHEMRQELEKQGLNKELIKVLLDSGKLDDYKELLHVYNKPDFVAKLVALWPRELASQASISVEEVESKIDNDVKAKLLEAVKQGKLDESLVKQVMQAVLDGKPFSEAMKIEKPENLEEEIMKLVKEKPGLSINAYMGLIMSRFRGEVSGKEAAEILKKILS